MNIQDYLLSITVVGDGKSTYYSLNELSIIPIYEMFSITFYHKSRDAQVKIMNASSILAGIQKLYCSGVVRDYKREVSLDKAVKDIFENADIISSDFSTIKKYLLAKS